MELFEVGADDPRLDEIVAVVRELRSHLAAEEVRDLYAEGHPKGYRLVGLWDEDECRAAAGYRLGVSFANGRYLYVEDLITSAGYRSRGYGKRLLDHLVGTAQDAGCDCVTLDSGVQRFRAHRFYSRERFVISSHHFFRALPGDGGTGEVQRMKEG